MSLVTMPKHWHLHATRCRKFDAFGPCLKRWLSAFCNSEFVDLLKESFKVLDSFTLTHFEAKVVLSVFSDQHSETQRSKLSFLDL